MNHRARLGFILVCILLDALGIGLIIPVLPRLIGTLTGTAGEQTWWYGAIMLSYGLMQFASAPILGALSDRIGRRPVLLGGILGLGIMFAVPAFVASLPLILASRILGGALSANTSVAQAYVADITQGFQRAACFGKIGAMYGVGFMVGPALGGILGHADPRLPFVAASVIALANFLYGSFVLPESLTERQSQPMNFLQNNPISAIVKLFELRALRLPAAVLILASLANGILQCSWALYSEYRYSFTPLGIGISVFALGLFISLAQGWLLPRVILKAPRHRLMAYALAASAACLLGIALSPFAAASVALLCLYSVSSIISPIVSGEVSRIAPPDGQGIAIGAVHSLNSLTGSVAPLFSTPLVLFTSASPATISAGMPFFACASLTAAASVLSLLIGKNASSGTGA